MNEVTNEISCHILGQIESPAEVQLDTGSGSNRDDWRQRNESVNQELSSEIVPHPFATMQLMCGDKAKITCVGW